MFLGMCTVHPWITWLPKEWWKNLIVGLCDKCRASPERRLRPQYSLAYFDLPVLFLCSFSVHVSSAQHTHFFSTVSSS